MGAPKDCRRLVLISTDVNASFRFLVAAGNPLLQRPQWQYRSRGVLLLVP